MNGWTIAALIIGFILGSMESTRLFRKSIKNSIFTGLMVVDGKAYTVTPMKKEVE